MNTNEKLKSLIIKNLTKDLSHAEIILDDDGSIWLIDREKKYWYLELEKSGKLWWRYVFFCEFFKFFSIERSEFEPIIVEWVEKVLKQKVISPSYLLREGLSQVEEALKQKVISPETDWQGWDMKVEEMLKQKVISLEDIPTKRLYTVEEVLKQKVISPSHSNCPDPWRAEEVLKRKVISPVGGSEGLLIKVEEVLKQKVISPETIIFELV